MKCPKCGTYNGKTNKFCRECGLHLAWVVEETPAPEGFAAAQDDVALGEELAAVYDLYESGDLDEALGGAEKIAHANPESTSVHGVLALVYERKGEMELASGNADAAHDFLHLALTQYEKIVTLNPNSAADMEKLVILREKLTGKKEPIPSLARRAASLRSVIATLPPQAIAAGSAFIIVCILGLILLVGSKGSEPTLPAPRVNESARVDITPSSNITTNNTPANGSYDLKAYTFAQPTQSAPKAPEASSAPRQIPPVTSQNQVAPAKLPPLTPELTLVPEPKKKEKATAKVEPAQPGNTKPKPTETAKANEPKESSTPRVDGRSMLASAIQLGNQGRNQEAIAAAQQAISLFQAEIDAGQNTNSATLGIRNAKMYISLWKQGNGE